VSVKLRLMRTGRKKQPAYRIVAVDSRVRRDGAYLEKIGHYNPLTRPAEIQVDDQKAIKWLSMGAIPSDTVRNLLSRRGLMLALSMKKHGVHEEEIWEKVAHFRLEKEEKLKLTDKAPILVKPTPIIKETREAAPEPKVETAAEPTVEAAPESTIEVPPEPKAEAAPEPIVDVTPAATSEEVKVETPTTESGETPVEPETKE
jgi:small subunit ribosomal protein S16